MYTTFPSYAQFLLDGFTEQAGNELERTQMADGYIEQAPGNSRSRTERNVTYRLASLQEKAAFDLWRRIDLRDGALHFAWPLPEDPMGATVVRARIVTGKVTYTALTNRLDEYSAAFTVEYWI